VRATAVQNLLLKRPLWRRNRGGESGRLGAEQLEPSGVQNPLGDWRRAAAEQQGSGGSMAWHSGEKQSRGAAARVKETKERLTDGPAQYFNLQQTGMATNASFQTSKNSNANIWRRCFKR
jgi:hypothetical protein